MEKNIGIIVIGRNEGERLAICFASIKNYSQRIVYVDSGSTDESLSLARQNGVNIVELDLSIPFSAARARNEGVQKLQEIYPTCEYVMFVDGDCEVMEGWMEIALAALTNNNKAAVVCGRRRERFPDKSVYNMLCDIEWETPIGQTLSCGGDSVMRLQAFKNIGGFRNSLIAGEEPELCYRLRMDGWEIWRIDAEMTIHDANMHNFRQWWKRSVRAGHAYAEASWLSRNDQFRMRKREVRSILFWGIFFPSLIVGTAFSTYKISFFLLTGYAILFCRIYKYIQLRQSNRKKSILYAFFCVLSRFSEAVGLIKFYLNKTLRRQSTLIEY